MTAHLLKIIPILLIFCILAPEISYAQMTLIKAGYGTEALNISIEPKNIAESSPNSKGEEQVVQTKDGTEIHIKNNNIFLITFINPLFITYEGIKIGCTKDDIIRKYGRPKIENANTLLYYNSGIGFELSQDKIIKILIFPTPAKTILGDGKIIAGERAGNINLDMMISDIEKIWNKPDYITKFEEPAKRKMYFYTDLHGVILITERNRIKEIAILSPLYTYEGVIRVGVSVNKIKSVMGEGLRKDNLIIYRDQGINFRIKNEIISEITIYSFNN